MISLTIARNPDGSEKHTLKNVRDTGGFCFNVVTQPVWKEMVDSANAIPADDSEFEKTGLTPIPCVKIKPPRQGGSDPFRMQAAPGDRARRQSPSAGDRRGDLHARRSGLHGPAAISI